MLSNSAILSGPTTVVPQQVVSPNLLSLVMGTSNICGNTVSGIANASIVDNKNQKFNSSNSNNRGQQQLWNESVFVQSVGENRTNFPRRLHAMLEEADHNGTSHVVSWQPHGRSFRVHYPKEFIEHIMPKVFRQSKWSSFQRQLNLYGFMRITDGPDKGAYYHPKFLRGQPAKSAQIVRTRIKGTKVRMATHPDDNPNFYKMPPLEPSKPKTNPLQTTLNNTNVAAALIAQAQQQQITLQQALALQKAIAEQQLPQQQTQQQAQPQMQTPSNNVENNPLLSMLTHASSFHQPQQENNSAIITDESSCTNVTTDIVSSQNSRGNLVTPDEEQQQHSISEGKQNLDDEVYDLLQSMFPKKQNHTPTTVPSLVPSDCVQSEPLFQDNDGSSSSFLTSCIAMGDSSSIFEPNDVGNLPKTDQKWGQLFEKIFEV